MPTTLAGGRLWDGLTATPVDAALTIDGDTIATIGTSAPHTDVLDVTGCTILPGLIESHAHLCFNAQRDWRAVFDADSPSRLVLRMAENARAMLRAGITTVRDLGAPTEAAIELRNAIRDGITPGPDLLVAGAPVTTTGGHCWFLGGEADGELGVRVRVRELAKAGVDWIKVMATGGGMTPGTNVLAPQYSEAELRACVDEAARLGLRVAAHCHGTPGIRLAAEAGAATLEHVSFRGAHGTALDDDVVQVILTSAAAVSPTVHSAYLRGAEAPRYAERTAVARGLVQAGCRILMSTDCGIPDTPHDVLPESIRVWAELTDTTPRDALAAATSAAAAILGLDDRGVLAEGRRADLLVVEGDPLTDLRALRKVRHVFRAGRRVGG